jgi:hypothetical protein
LFGGVLSFGQVRTLAAVSFMGEGLLPPALPPPSLQALLALPPPSPRSPPVVDSVALNGGVFKAPLFVDGVVTNPALERDPPSTCTPARLPTFQTLSMVGEVSRFSDVVHLVKNATM